MALRERLSNFTASINLGGAKAATLTLALEGPSVNLVVFQEGAVMKWVTLPFNPRMLSAGGVQDPEGVAKAITSAMKRIGAPNAPLLAAYPSARLSARTITLPPIKGVKPEMVIPREARRLMGSTVDLHHLFWAPLKGIDSGNSYYLLAVPKKELDNFMKSLAFSGLKPRRIEARFLALARAVNQPDAVIVHLRSDRIDVLVVTKSVPLVTTQRNFETMLSPEDLIVEVYDHVQQAINFNNERGIAGPLPRDAAVYVCGRHYKIDLHLLRSLQESIGRPVHIPDPDIAYPPGFPVLDYMVNIGLALGQ